MPNDSTAPEAVPDMPAVTVSMPTRPADAPRRSGWTLERVVRIVLTTAALVVLALLVSYFSRLVVYLVVGALLAYITRPLMDWLQGVGLGRVPAILVTFVIVFGLLGVVVTSLVPFITSQVTELSQQVTPQRVNEIAADVEERIIQLLPVADPESQRGIIRSGLQEVFTTLFQEERITSMVTSVVDLFTNLFYALLVIPFIMFFFLKDGSQIKQSLLRLVPNRYFEVTLNVVEKVETNIGRYFQALLLQCFSVGALAAIVLYFVGLEYALVVGVFTGLANTIPYFGPFMGFLAGTLVGIAQTGDFSLVPGVLLAMLITQVADNVLFQPLIFSRAARAHPLLILFVVLIGAQLGGIVGMLVAIPLLTTLRVAAEQVWWSVRNYRILQAGR